MKVAANDYVIRAMTRSELDFAIRLASQAGWNPGLHDADCFYQTDPNGFLIGLLNDQPIGCISAVSYPGNFGFLGFYIVVPEYRGQGYGIQLWNAAINYLRGHNIGLDGVLEQQSNYQRSGFQLAHRNIRYAAMVEVEQADTKNIVDLRQVAFADLCAYDRPLFPADRARFLKAWIQMPQAKAIAMLEDQAIVGYGVIRQCHQGYKIGPLFANSSQIAEALLLNLARHPELGSLLYLDLPEINKAAIALADRYQMKPVFETARMYTQAQPTVAGDRIFGVTTFELG
jgi:GNAT superfamily N-acetyltransferase